MYGYLGASMLEIVSVVSLPVEVHSSPLRDLIPYFLFSIVGVSSMLSVRKCDFDARYSEM